MANKFPGGIPDAMLKEVKMKALDPNFRQDNFNRASAQFGVYSLSADCTDQLMWAHYGRNHQGYCLEFSDFMSLCMDRTEPRLLITEVEYAANRLAMSSRAWLERLGTRPPATETDMKWMWHKSECWRYEKEWRLLASQAGSTGRLKPFAPRHLAGIIFGYRCKQEDEQSLRAWSANHLPTLRFSRMGRSSTDFSLERLPA
jgi:hypothetical protein